jgi:hypothetical protein
MLAGRCGQHDGIGAGAVRAVSLDGNHFLPRAFSAFTVLICWRTCFHQHSIVVSAGLVSVNVVQAHVDGTGVVQTRSFWSIWESIEEVQSVVTLKLRIFRNGESSRVLEVRRFLVDRSFFKSKWKGWSGEECEVKSTFVLVGCDTTSSCLCWWSSNPMSRWMIYILLELGTHASVVSLFKVA